MKHITICLGIILLSMFFFNGQSQQNEERVLKGPYLGQTPPGKTPELFAPGIISTNMNAARIAIAPDGKEIFFRLMAYDHSFMTLVFMREKNGMWSKPEVAPFSGRWNDGEPFFSLDGARVFFTSNRSLKEQKGPKDFDIWVVERKGTDWGVPQNLGSTVNSDKNEVNPAISRDGTLYFNSNRDGGKGNSDIYKSELKNGKYTCPENLGDSINTRFTESGPYIAPDESFIIFNRYHSDTGNGLYISFKKNDGSWSRAISMGKMINAEDGGSHGFVSTDGKYLFFTSKSNPHFQHPDHNLSYDEIVRIFNGPFNGSYNIFWVDAKVIKELKHESIK